MDVKKISWTLQTSPWTIEKFRGRKFNVHGQNVQLTDKTLFILFSQIDFAKFEINNYF